jgi:hypothetical protein
LFAIFHGISDNAPFRNYFLTGIWLSAIITGVLALKMASEGNPFTMPDQYLAPSPQNQSFTPKRFDPRSAVVLQIIFWPQEMVAKQR